MLLHENQSILAFHDHGMQGRSIRTNEVFVSEIIVISNAWIRAVHRILYKLELQRSLYFALRFTSVRDMIK